MSDSLYQRAKRLGITDDELGISTDADARAAAPELDQQAAVKRAEPKMNGMPVPAGTPNHLIPLYKVIPHHNAERYKKIWDKFEKQDLTLVEFSIEMECTMNQNLIQSDLQDLLVRKEINRN